MKLFSLRGACFAFLSININFSLVAAPDTVDSTFATSAGQIFDSSDFGGVSSSLVRPDGVVVFGSNQMPGSIDGGSTTLEIPLIALNPDGTVVSVFGADVTAGGGKGIVSYVGEPEVHALALQSDNKLIAAGDMSGYSSSGTGLTHGGQSIVRFNTDGSPDSTFTTQGTTPSLGFNFINDVEVQPDGKLLVAGGFGGITDAGGTAHARLGLARLNSDGSVDTGFAINPADFGAAGELYGFFRDVELAPDGKIYIVGRFYSDFVDDGVWVFGRLNSDGSRDSSFQPTIFTTISNVQAVDLDGAGRVVFIAVEDGTQATYMRRYFSDGTLDGSFTLAPSLVQVSNEQLEETPSGQYYLSTPNNGTAGDRLVRINADGSIDNTFNAQSDHPDAPIGPSAGNFRCMALSSDGFLYSGAFFSSVNGVSTRKIVKFEGDYNPTSPGILALAASNFSVDEDAGSMTVTVNRSAGTNGAASVNFATSDGTATAGSDYTSTNGTLTWAAGEGGAKSFTVPISSDANVESAETMILTLSGASGATLGLSSGTLTINDSDSPPTIITQPEATVFVVPGFPLNLTVGAVSASTPTTFQWFKGGVAISGANAPAYTISAADVSDSGDYTVTVTNPNGSVTSSTSVVSVKVPATLSFSSPQTVNVVESDGTFDLILSREDSSVNAVSVQVTALPDTASEGGDFAVFAQTVSWADGDVADKTITLTLIDDGISEAIESFTLELSDWSLDARALPSSTTVVEVIIADDDTLATIDSFSEPVITSEGSEVTLSVSVTSQTSVSYQWYRNGVLLGGETADSLQLLDVSDAEAGSYTVEITNDAGVVTSDEALVQVTPANLLISPITPASFTSGSPAAFAPEANGGIYVGGGFNTVDGEFIRTLARLNVDGTLDNSFDAGLSSSETISHLRITSGGDIIAAGEDFSTNPGVLDNRLAKISSAGLVDTTFATNVGTAFDGPITDVEIAADGSIYVVGDFTGLIKKLSPTGVVDATFAPTFIGVGLADPELYDLEIVGSSLYVGGQFDNGSGVEHLAKLDLNGNIDGTFQSGLTARARNLSQTLTGEILFEVNQNSQGWFVRKISPTGVLDPNYSVDAFTAPRVHLPDGDVLFAGSGFLKRVADDGTPDLAYEAIAGTAFNSNVSDIGLASDGAVWAVGGFSEFNGESALRVIRLADLDDSVVFTQQPASLSSNLGDDATFSALASGAELITTYQWYFNGSLLSDGADYSGTTTNTLTVLAVADTDEGDYTVVATNAAGQSATSDAGVLSVFGAPDISFIEASPQVVLVGDSVDIEASLTGAGPIDYEFFLETTSLATGSQAGQSGTISFNIPSAALSDRGSYTITATNSEGTSTSAALFLDVRESPTTIVSGFTAVSNFSNGAVTGIATLPDGGAYLAGSYSFWYFPPTEYRNVVVRVDAQGAIVPSFNPVISGSAVTSKVVTLNDGSVVVSGAGISLDGATGQRLVKMDALGARNTAFTTNIMGGPNNDIFDLAVDDQDRIYVYGNFTDFGGTVTTGFVRLNSDGTLDSSFSPILSSAGTTGSIEFAANGDIYLLHATTLVKISTAGVVDSAFSIPGTLSGFTIDSQNRLIVMNSNDIRRYDINGVEDVTFDPTPSEVFINYQVIDVDVNADDQVLLLRQNTVSRFNTDGSRDLSFSGISFSGSFPNRDAAVFEIGADGGIWVGGSFTSNPMRKYVKYVGTPADVAIVQQPQESVVEPTSNTTFSVSAIGTGPLEYQWSKGGIELSDDAKFAGTDTSTLSITGAVEADEGDYSVEVTNTLTLASKTSFDAALVVLGLPEFLSQPESQSILVDTALNLNVDVQASAPFTAQWFKDGIPLSNGGTISGADTLTLTIDPLTASGAGDYTISVTNSFGSTTSNPAEISTFINPASIVAGFNAPTFNSTVRAILPLPSGQALVGGQFTSVTDSVSTYSRTGLALVNSDGTIDPNFSIAASGVYDLELQSDGKVLLAGDFTSVGGQSRPRHARLNSDLTLDTGYSPTASPNSSILTILEDVEGSVWIGGFFSSISGTVNPSAYIAKLDNSGEPVSGQVSANSVVYDLVNAQDGDVLVAGSFSSFLGGQYVVKINKDLTLDTAYSPANFAYAVDEDSVGNVYAAYYNDIAKFAPTGAKITSFVKPSEWSSANQVYDIAVQENGRVVGGFQSSPYVGRVESSGALDTTFDLGTGLNNRVEVVALQNTGAIWIGGTFTSFDGNAVGRLLKLEGDLVDIAIRQNPVDAFEDVGTTAQFTVVAETFGGEPIGYQWRKDGVDLTDGGDISGASTSTLSIANIEASDEGFYDVVTTNLTTTSDQTSTAAELTVLESPEILELSLDQNLESNDALSLAVVAQGATGLTYQWRQDGVDIFGATDATYEVPLAQVSDSGVYTVVITNSLGTVTSDPINVTVILAPAGIQGDFSELTFNSTVNSVLPLRDGRTLVGGSFSRVTYQGTQHFIGYLALVNADGSLDTTFNLNVNNTITRLRYDLEGRVLISGSFNFVGGQQRASFARLQSDLTVDTTFGGSTGPNNIVQDIAAGSDGYVYLAGAFSSFGGQSDYGYLCRVDSTGALDDDFITPLTSSVNRVAPQNDGSLVVGGIFSVAGRNYFARLHNDGSVDSGFAGGSTFVVRDFDQFEDGSWIVVGNFSNAIRRYDSSGTIDNSWSATVNSTINAVAVEDDDQILIAGSFTNVEGQSQNYVARLDANGDLDTSFTIGTGANNTVTAVALEPLGAIWLGGAFTEYRGELAGRLVRLYGDAVPVAIVQSPTSAVVNPGSTASFTVLAASDDTLSYQWRRNGNPLSNGGDISGATTDTLEIANAELADEDIYDVVVTNTVTTDSKTSASASLTVLDAPEILEQPEAQVLEWETLLELEVDVRGVAPLTYQWFKDSVPLSDGGRISGATSSTLSITPTEVADSADYEVVITNALGSVSSDTVSVTVFIPQGKEVPGLSKANINSTVRAFLPLGDGRALIGGQFSSPRSRLALLNTDGSLDSGFNLNLNNSVYTLKFDSEGRILVGGDFTLIDGQAYQRVARLNADLSLDTSFEPLVGPNNTVFDIAESADGSVWVGGLFSGLSDGSSEQSYLVKFDSLGQVDDSFTDTPNSTVYSVEALGDGSVLIGGQFSNYQASGRNYLAKLDANGDLVLGFTPSVNNFVYDIELQSDGKLLVGGRLSHFLQRFNADGTSDTTFASGVSPRFNNYVWSIATQLDGDIYVAGQFSMYDGENVSRIARLNGDGTLDTEFDVGSGFNNTAFTVATEPLGNVWFGGQFTLYRGGSVPRFVKLNGYEAPVGITQQPLPISLEEGQDATFTVSAGGTAPLTYQWRKDGVDLSGETSNSLTVSSIIEADEGDYDVVVTNATEGLSVISRPAELTFLGTPELLVVSEGASLFVGDSIEFSVVARGAATLTYQWNFEGNPIVGQTQPTLSLSEVDLPDDGDYTVTVTNGIGSVTSSDITLIVNINAAAVDPDFRSGNGNNASANNRVESIVTLSDGSAVVGGLFSSISGGSASRIAKIDTDGELVAGWGPIFNSTVNVIKEQSDGKFLVGGAFSSVNSDSSYQYLVRLNSDGTLDTSYDPDVNSTVYDIAFFSNGDAAIVGTFSQIAGASRAYLARLSSVGVVDTNFRVTTSRWVGEVEVDSLDRVYVGSISQNAYPVDDGVTNFSSNYLRFFRTTAAGLLDTSYTPASNSFIYDMQIQSDDSLLVAGAFTSIGGQLRSYFAKLDTAGAADPALPNLNFNSSVNAFAVDSSGNIIASGNFTSVLGEPQPRIAMITPSQELEPTFFAGTGFNSSANKIEVGPLGRIWVGGNFTTYNSAGALYLLRLVGYSGAEESSFASFIEDAGLTGPDAAFDFDYDNDGIDNGLEYLLGGNPAVADSGLLPTSTLQGGAALGTGDTEEYMTIEVSIREELAGANWGVEVSETLPFTSPQAAVQVGTPTTVNGMSTYLFRMPWPVSDPVGSGFMRVTYVE